MTSPLVYLNTEVNVWKSYGLFAIDAKSASVQRFFKIYCIFFQLTYIDMGCAMQTLAVINAKDIKEGVEIFFISIAYMNAAFKFFIAYRKRAELQTLWKILDAPEFHTVVAQENE